MIYRAGLELHALSSPMGTRYALGLLSHSKNSIPVWFCLFWRAEELHALSYALLYIIANPRQHCYDVVM